jgi:ergothioneine biosynthesis protein EgtB
MTTTLLLNRSNLAAHFQACRQFTLALFDGMDYDTFVAQPHADFSPVGWHLGHIAYTEALWILQRLAGAAPVFPQYHRLFAQDGLAKCDRVHLPPISEVLDYLDKVRSQVLDYLAIAPLEDQQRLWYWLLQHEVQHVETISIVLALQTPPQPIEPCPPSQPTPMCLISAGSFVQGSDGMSAIDNERPAYDRHLDAYWIDQYPVTQGDYWQFIEAGGYRTRAWWSEAGWAWLQANPVSQPLYWRNQTDRHPVCGVSWYEAEAYARFVGKRLPTESEWEKAAIAVDGTQSNHQQLQHGTTVVDRYPAAPSGCYDLLGNVWEWTDSWFAPYPNFASFPYPGYSQAYFDHAHRVLRGGSWATGSWGLRPSFRNWYHPQVRQVFAGFRCARDAE